MLYYDEYGSKENPTIMLLHGAGALDTFCRQYCFSDKYHLSKMLCLFYKMQRITCLLCPFFAICLNLACAVFLTHQYQYGFSDKYHLVVPHLAGAGKAATEIYEPEKTVEELFMLIKSLHKKRIGVIGHSLGGQIAIMLVSKQFQALD